MKTSLEMPIPLNLDSNFLGGLLEQFTLFTFPAKMMLTSPIAASRIMQQTAHVTQVYNCLKHCAIT